MENQQPIEELKYGVYQYSATNYIYYEYNGKNNESDRDCKKEYCISLQNYIFEDENNLPEIISNYFIDDPILDEVSYFASIVWNKIDYVDEDYNPYNYDPDPKFIIYRDDMDNSRTNKYLFILNKLEKKFYSSSTHYKHFNPELEKKNYQILKFPMNIKISLKILLK
jgi:hypothetical protein